MAERVFGAFTEDSDAALFHKSAEHIQILQDNISIIWK